ncbi:putative Boron transporter [Tripterygium wilfordii]|uniref:Putative Boron transporter n=1 Tax=Tripterygium wilfordii TaxID=458696 RepID=A0A7J7D5S4_TRIWF|nr:putative Boron transporter [Tripterygium wilfordii]
MAIPWLQGLVSEFEIPKDEDNSLEKYQFQWLYTNGLLAFIRKKMVESAKESIKQKASNSEIYGKMQAVFLEIDSIPVTTAVEKELEDLKEAGHEDSRLGTEEGGVQICDAEILDGLTTNRGELKVRNVSFSEERHGLFQVYPEAANREGDL